MSSAGRSQIASKASSKSRAAKRRRKSSRCQTAIFSLKQGEVSDPVRTKSGFYLYRLEELKIQPYDDVKDNIFIQIQAIKFREWYQGLMKNLDVKIAKPEFFAPPPAGPASGTN